MHLRIESEDFISVIGNEMHADIGENKYIFNLDSIIKIVLITTDLGPVYDDMCMAIDVGNDTVVFIMSEHKCFKDVLFEQIGKVLPIDFQKVIDASVCIERNVFEIYRRTSLSDK